MTEKQFDCIKKVNRIIRLAMFISYDSEADIFVYYSPHVNGLTIRGFSHGWKANVHDDIPFPKDIIYLNDDDAILDELIQTLIKMAVDTKFSSDDVHRIISDMETDYRELAWSLDYAFDSNANGLVFASAIKDTENYNVCSYIKGDNVLCVELLKKLIVQAVDFFDNDLAKLVIISKLDKTLSELKKKSTDAVISKAAKGAEDEGNRN